MDNSGDKTLVDAMPTAESIGGDDLLVVLADLQHRFATVITEVEPTRPVPWCGAWTVSDLVDHLTSVHRWAAAMARNEDHPDHSHPGAGAEVEELRRRYESAAADLLDTLSSLDASAPARTLVDGGTVAFWRRRQVHETLVHLWDLCTAAGQDLLVQPTVWADTVDEALTVMHPRQVRLGRAGATRVRLVVVADDVDRTWHLPGAPSGLEPVATVSGPAEALALLAWGRTPVTDERLRVDGDLAALAAVLADRFLP